MRVGVGVGAVMLGGCDAVAEAKARVLGEGAAEAAAPVEVAAPPAPVARATPDAPEPMLLPRDGIAGVVEQARSQAATPSSDRVATTAVTPVEDIDRPRFEPEGSRGFVPYEGGLGALASAPAPAERTTASPKPRTRPRPKTARPVEAEPCDPLAAPVREWSCGPCGRG